MIILGFIILMGIISASTSKETVEVKENSLLVAKFNAQILDRTNEDPFAMLFSGNFIVITSYSIHYTKLYEPDAGLHSSPLL